MSDVATWAPIAAGIATGVGAVAVAGISVYRKFKAALGSPAPGDASLRDLVLEVRGELRAMAARLEAQAQVTAEHSYRLSHLENPWAGRTRPGLGSNPGNDAE